MQRCRRQGPVACTESLDATTTTTTFSYSYPTTTVPGAGIDVTVHDVRTDFEVDVYVPAAGAQYVLVDVTIENERSWPIRRRHVFQTTMLRLATCKGRFESTFRRSPSGAASSGT